MASSEPLAPVHPAYLLRPEDTWSARGSQLYSACPFFRAIGPTPADRVVFVAVRLPPVLPSTIFERLGIHKSDKSVRVGRVTRLHLFALCYGPEDCLPFTDKGFYIRAFIPRVTSLERRT